MYSNTFTFTSKIEERLDKYLTEQLPLNRSQIKKLIQSGNIKVNSKIVKAGYLLSFNDTITVFYEDEADLKLVPENIEFKIIYEDADIAIISKPQNLVVHPGAGNLNNTLVNGLLYEFDNLANTEDNALRPGIVHRLDKDTSGLMIIAKSNRAYYKLVDDFKNGKINKTYLAIVEGNLYEDNTIETLIGRDPKNRIKMAVVEKNGKLAITKYNLIKNYRGCSLISLNIYTGRTHQIRVHMRYINHPVLGDPLYGNKNKYKIDKQMLHAYSLSFYHPVTNEKLCFKDEFPIRFNDFLNKVQPL
ncbi:23S rRNA pseudouridine1911/1915/1917 synthase [Anaerosphaera aminiphila DSM 21120]|uniref:Pseudouridine synthase n=1 Tax=Anaerosphaera aminiphila DSM 21120 TaxID=1120995 RepID=A0A1M5NWG8_9FIRM|nr:RluA family pseudouridine synthase [Anaerosphaera aminiphila]SHG93509.1 23S rRNA pseudouridine1911/1915/1917 synthase [Anaerosphaera aminiphila DSM 21120]